MAQVSKYFYGTTSGYSSPPLSLNIANATPGDPLTLVFDAKANCGVDLLGCRGVVTFTVTGNGVVLPLSLTNFNAGYNKFQHKVSLSWIAEAASKNSTFIIERSSDGKGFFPIGEVKVHNQNSNYTYSDERNLMGVIYYRLKLTEADGKFSYSKITVVNIEHTAFVFVYPNPVYDVLNVVLYMKGKDKARIVLMNTIGSIELSGNYNLSAGRNEIKLNTNSLSKGTYFIKVKLDGSGDNFINKLIVQ